MARQYFAPGVYVEEVSSTGQPIAGVGTSTAAFIGVVPERIYYAVANTSYDPVEQEKQAKQEEERRKQQELTKQKPQPQPVGTSDTNTVETPSDTATAAEKGAKTRILETNTKKTESSEDALKNSGDEVNNFEIKSYDPRHFSAGLTKNDSKIRPYYLEEFVVPAKEFDTKLCTNFSEYVRWFGNFSAFSDTPDNPDDPDSDWRFSPIHRGHHLLTHAVAGFFRNGGTKCFVARVTSDSNLGAALEQFKSIDEVSIIAAPGLPKTATVWSALEDYCQDPNMQNVFAVLDPPIEVGTPGALEFNDKLLAFGAPVFPARSPYAAYYFPSIEVSDPAKLLQDSDPARKVAPRYRGRTYVAPSGHVAGIYARIDETRGVHKAPANAGVRGALDVRYYVGRAKQELLNPHGVNCIRMMNGEVTVWGARTVGGRHNGEFMYVNVRRFMGFLEESLDEGTQWIVFEPNDPNLWSKIILNVTAFLTNVWRDGALFGLTPQEAFYVKCDAELNPPEVRDLGMVVTEVGVAIVRPAEFVIFRITQAAGGTQP